MSEVFTPRLTHLRLIEAEAKLSNALARIEALEARLAERSDVFASARADRRAKKAAYMREYMAKKRASENVAN